MVVVQLFFLHIFYSKEKLAKLERENKRLKEHLAVEVENNIADLTHQLEDANRLNEVLKKEIQGLGGYVCRVCGLGNSCY